MSAVAAASYKYSREVKVGETEGFLTKLPELSVEFISATKSFTEISLKMKFERENGLKTDLKCQVRMGIIKALIGSF